MRCLRLSPSSFLKLCANIVNMTYGDRQVRPKLYTIVMSAVLHACFDALKLVSATMSSFALLTRVRPVLPAPLVAWTVPLKPTLTPPSLYKLDDEGHARLCGSGPAQLGSSMAVCGIPKVSPRRCRLSLTAFWNQAATVSYQALYKTP